MKPNTKLWAAALVVAVILSVTIARLVAAREFRQSENDATLRPIATLLEANQKILASLVSEGNPATESAILERYLSDIRRDGVPKHSATRRQLDALVDNNTAIVALLTRHADHPRTAAFAVQTEKYREYAVSLRDRWHATFETFMAGGNLPAAGPERPASIGAALAGEMAAP